VTGFAVKVFFFASPAAKAEIEPLISRLDPANAHEKHAGAGSQGLNLRR
jgi:hypothetical protein